MYFNTDIKSKGQFSLVAEEYDLARPFYPQTIYNDAIKTIRRHGLKSGKLENVLEIGGGSGQATVKLRKFAAHLDCIEPGKTFASILRRRFRSNKKVRIFRTTFEQFESSYKYDLVASACAIHWIPKKTFYRRIRLLLKPGGWVLGIWHQPSFSDSVYEVIGDTIKPRFPQFWIPQNTHENQKLFEKGFYEFSKRKGFINCWHKTYARKRHLSPEICSALIWSYVDISSMKEGEKNKMKENLYKSLLKLPKKELVARDNFPVAMGQIDKEISPTKRLHLTPARAFRSAS
jgi:SAM-dependent methyltransferase